MNPISGREQESRMLERESTAIKPLLFAPEIYRDECDLGYALRVACKNGLATPTGQELCSITRSIGHQRQYPFMTALADRLAEAHGNRVSAIWPSFRGHTRPNLLSRRGTMPRLLCADCMDEAPYIRAAWQTKYFTLCHRHQKPLVQTWSGQLERASPALFTPAWRSCVCGPTEAHQDVNVCAQNLASTLFSGWSDDQGPVIWACSVFAQRLLEALVAARRTFDLSGEPKTKASGTVLQKAARWLELYEIPLECTVQGLEALLKKLCLRLHLLATKQVILACMEDAKSDDSLLRLLPLQAWLVMVDHEELRKPKRGYFTPFIGKRPVYNGMTVVQTQRDYQIKPWRLKEITRLLGLKPRKILELSFPLALFDMEDVAKIVEYHERYIDRRETAKRLGVTQDKAFMQKLRKAGLLRQSPLTLYDYEAASVDELVNKLRSHAATVQLSQKVWSIHTLLKHVNLRDMHKVLHHLNAGAIRLYRPNNEQPNAIVLQTHEDLPAVWRVGGEKTTLAEYLLSANECCFERLRAA